MTGSKIRAPRDVGGGASSQAMADFVVEFAVVKSSSLAEANNAVQWALAGAGGFDLTDPTAPGIDPDRVAIDVAEQFGALGIVGRPLPPSVTNGVDEFTEVACVKANDGLIPIAARDTRLGMQGDGPAEGTLAFVGYGGGFHSMSPVPAGGTPEGGGTIHVLYCPFDFDDDGVAQKAHTITLDPAEGNESISVVHAGGQALLLQNDGSVTMQSVDGQTFIKVEDGKLTIQSEQIVLSGTTFVGDPSLGVPLLAGPASPPCARLFLSPL